MRKESVGYLLVIASGVIYGLMPLMSRLVSADGVSSLSITAFRAWAAMAVLSPAWLSPGRGRVKITLRQLPWVVCAAVLGYILTPLLLIDSYAYIDTGMATTLHYVIFVDHCLHKLGYPLLSYISKSTYSAILILSPLVRTIVFIKTSCMFSTRNMVQYS